MKKNLFSILILVTLNTSIDKILIAQASNKSIDSIEAILPVLDKLFMEHARKNHLPGFVYGIVVDGKVVHTTSMGYSDLDKKIPVTTRSVFRIASMTKSFTAMAILKLRDEGKLRLDDDVAETSSSP